MESMPPFVSAIKISDSHDIGNLVKNKRKQRRMTQAQLAKAAGVGTRFISELENGKATLQLNKILDVLVYLQMSLYIN